MGASGDIFVTLRSQWQSNRQNLTVSLALICHPVCIENEWLI